MPLLTLPSCRQRAFPTLRNFNSLGCVKQNICRRYLLTLAIETSCDDTSVAILQKNAASSGVSTAELLFHEKVTADNSLYKGIHPLKSLESHQAELPALVSRALQSLPRIPEEEATALNSLVQPAPSGVLTSLRKPDFLTATRGPGMRSSLSAGLDLAKGLAIAWNLPLVGVHHMQAHALTPRLALALETTSRGVKVDGNGNSGAVSSDKGTGLNPTFPFLTMLVSGGHTLLLHSQSLNQHTTLANTVDIAVGDCIDKIARTLLPQSILASIQDASYGRLLESWVFPPQSNPTKPYPYEYNAPARRSEEIKPHTRSGYDWYITPPLADVRSMRFAFTGVESSITRLVGGQEKEVSEDERKALGRVAMEVVFEHLASRVILALKQLRSEGRQESMKTLVVSGGVAANMFLRHVLRCKLDVRGFEDVELVFPPLELCTDNAAMIAWAGMEMWEAGWKSDLSCLPERRWSLDSPGVLGVEGWTRREDAEMKLA